LAGQNDVPGGHIDLGKSAAAAGRRGTREETGFEIHDLEFLCWQGCAYDGQFWKPWNSSRSIRKEHWQN
jgi:ADP-ribose pyrophosphatase YjhB (NUDIX family)